LRLSALPWGLRSPAESSGLLGLKGPAALGMAGATDAMQVPQMYPGSHQMQPEPPTPAHVVGNSFVNQYYTVLHSSPKFLHRFYTDASSLTLAEYGSDGPVETVLTQRGIHAKVMSLGYDEYKAEIHSVDSQYSLNGGVLVQVTGALINKAKPQIRREFVQSFFLAVQERGYYVLNDIFRYVSPPEKPVMMAPEMMAPVPMVSPMMVPIEYQQMPVPVPHPMPETMVAAPAVAVPTAPAPAAPAPVAEVPPPAPKPVENGHVVAEPALAEEPSTAETAKEDDADLPKEDTNAEPPAGPAAPATYASVLAKLRQQAEKAAPAEKAAAAPAAEDGKEPAAAEESQAPEEEGAECCSVFVRNIPSTADEAELERLFSAYGPLRNGAKGISLKFPLHKGGAYAFIDFMDVQSVRAAIEATIEMEGKVLLVEEKKPNPATNLGRITDGRRDPGRRMMNRGIGMD